jgi:alpha-beta hydrolase superfamily lysophospholipase
MVLGVMTAGAAGIVLYANSLGDLAPWHTAALDAEFTAEGTETTRDLDGYLLLEDRLFAQLAEDVVAPLAGADTRRFNRYIRGSWSDPTRHPVNWNRTRILPRDNPQALVLMLHGLTDSPYSLRALAEAFHDSGAHVVVLRLPGHGTVPASLTELDWPDLAAAVRLAAKDLAQRNTNNRPFYMVGYSNGAALAVEYCLSALNRESLPTVDGLLLLSPAITIDPAAALAKWSRRLSLLPGLEKLAWTGIQLEFDPFKYNSFPVHAGDQIHRLSLRIASLVNTLDPGGGIPAFPPVLAVQPITDATIVWRGVIDGLLARLAPNNHRLLLYDVNQMKAFAFLYDDARVPGVAALMNQKLSFGLSVITNADPDTAGVVVKEKPAGSLRVRALPLRAAWPEGVFAVSHVAVPFAPDDPIYGDTGADGGPSFSLGALRPRGERQVLRIPADTFLRLRYNPFFDDLLHRSLTHFGLADESPAANGS